jgi:adenosylcobyric acid synthase
LRYKNTFFCIDESFSDFIPSYKTIAVLNIPNIIVIRSLTKFYGIPGLRLGVCLADSAIIQKILDTQIPWSVNTLAQKIGEKLFDDNQYFESTVKAVIHLRKDFEDELSKFSWLNLFQSETNFILIKLSNPDLNIKKLYNFLAEKGIIIRLCDSFKALNKSFFRIAIRSPRENKQLIRYFNQFSEIYLQKSGINSNSKNPKTKQKKALALMIQGTASNAGKSILTAGLCRVLTQEGYSVAPFKAQNMSNNSAVTLDGKEIGRAQALQARACNITPDVRMNPVLLKPSSENRSQVILNGIAEGFMTVQNWKQFKEKARTVIEKNYTDLAADFDIIIIEGAGSPGEVNLKQDDIVNMGMARYADAPVLITGDIDRGGLYASFIGTMAVFEEWERNLVKGFIVNKFRGDSSLLTSAHNYLSEYTGKKVLGVIPYIPNLNLPEEDSVSLIDGSYFNSDGSELISDSEIRIGLINLPYISNFTDMDPLMQEQDIKIILIKTPEDLNNKYDCIIIPGSKNTSSDLTWLKEKGFHDKFKKINDSGTTIVGICGGFQILGKRILDPEYVEMVTNSINNSIQGLGMIDMETTFYPEKQLARKKTLHIPSGHFVNGYEIHHGISHLKQGEVILDSKEGLLGASSSDGKVWGTYLHGIFESDNFRYWFLNKLRVNKGLPESNMEPSIYDIDISLDKLAEILRENLDIKHIKTIIGL